MAKVVADTHKVITRLVERGYKQDQVEAFTEVLQERDFSELASKADLKDLSYQLTWNFFGLLMAQGALVVAVLQYLQ